MTGSSQEAGAGLIGAGRLGRALAWVHEAKLGRPPPVWSRRFEQGGVEPGLSARPLEQVLEGVVVISAISNAALYALSHRHKSLFGRFGGLFLLAGADAPDPDLNARAPHATFARIVPVLLPGQAQITTLALRPPADTPAWRQGCACLEALGTLTTVDCERAYSELMILTSPFAAVVRAAIARAITGYLQDRQADPDWLEMALDVASLSLAGTPGLLVHDQGDAGPIATPGGITEAGLAALPGISGSLQSALSMMRTRADAPG